MSRGPGGSLRGFLRRRRHLGGFSVQKRVPSAALGTEKLLNCHRLRNAKGPGAVKLPGLPSHGGDKGIRTLGLCLAKAALSQLSYIPKCTNANCVARVGHCGSFRVPCQARAQITEKFFSPPASGLAPSSGRAGSTNPRARRRPAARQRGRSRPGRAAAPPWGRRQIPASL